MRYGQEMRRYSEGEDVMILRMLHRHLDDEGQPKYYQCRKELAQWLGKPPSYEKLKSLWASRDQYDLSQSAPGEDTSLQELGAAELQARQRGVRENYLDLSETGTEIMMAYLNHMKRQIQAGNMPDHKQMYQLATMTGIATDKFEKLLRAQMADQQPKAPTQNILQIFNLKGEDDSKVQEYVKQLRRKASEEAIDVDSD